MGKIWIVIIVVVIFVILFRVLVPVNTFEVLGWTIEDLENQRLEDVEKFSQISPEDKMRLRQVKIKKDRLQDRILGYQGQIIFGDSASKILEFDQSDYQLALEHNKLVVLYFSRADCKSCEEEFLKMKSTFLGLDNARVVGFKVWLDDLENHNLVYEYKVVRVLTKLIIANGNLVVRSSDNWEGWMFENQIKRFL